MEDVSDLLDKYSELTFDEILEHVIIKPIFHQFCKKKFCFENIDFYDKIQEYKQIEDLDERRELGRYIFDNFVLEGVDDQVNLDSIDVQIIEENLEQAETDLFDKSQTFVYNLMKEDLFTKFVTSDFLKKELTKLNKPLLPSAEEANKDDKIILVQGWAHKGAAETNLSKKIRKQLEQMEKTKKLGGDDALQLSDEYDRLSNWCKTLEQQHNKNEKQKSKINQKIKQIIEKNESLRKDIEVKKKKLQQAEDYIQTSHKLLIRNNSNKWKRLKN
eukprot:TRINITY_DN2798_c0_g1_i2.p1 TRINITY_DN2798_c0_g1~~TRINITY_DN2798_c0_g1_i2.p1  ORF type:complete len:273 (+),score=50.62 TRINITY_DN2798_c0_g1_i2:64-882(+)